MCAHANSVAWLDILMRWCHVASRRWDGVQTQSSTLKRRGAAPFDRSERKFLVSGDALKTPSPLAYDATTGWALHLAPCATSTTQGPPSSSPHLLQSNPPQRFPQASVALHITCAARWRGPWCRAPVCKIAMARPPSSCSCSCSTPLPNAFPQPFGRPCCASPRAPPSPPQT